MMKPEIKPSCLILEPRFNHHIALQIHLPVSFIQIGSLAAMLGICDLTILITTVQVRCLTRGGLSGVILEIWN